MGLWATKHVLLFKILFPLGRITLASFRIKTCVEQLMRPHATQNPPGYKLGAMHLNVPPPPSSWHNLLGDVCPFEQSLWTFLLAAHSEV